MDRGKVLRAVNNCITIVFIIVMVIIAFTIVSAKASGQEPSFFGYKIKTVLSGSMEPEIQTGSVILIEETNNHLLKVGDVITFLTKESILVTHRIVETMGNEYVTKGDNNNGNDVNTVLTKNIVGKYTEVTIPYIGYVIIFINTKLGSALLLILPGFYLIGYSLTMIRHSFKQVESTVNKTPAHNDK